ncbi:Crp/Fnr family transcriptional regulator [Lujinxingia vulgaris]|uniref:Crp/Fnr family transcriptional regulator n=1 Tax=Lujinxingia vulgaris TaxID=2600176 RepID=A0A5C6XA77_9DELT|nr:helix-turn-helix domain-containing protein [Lujinxingia vulgaris]TXD38857.1 Crp/Fnr family transcriptional regulator [Lujinxingia vulgaris]
MAESQSTSNLWHFRQLITGPQARATFDRLRERGRVERWGHAARIHLDREHDERVVVLEGQVILGSETTLARGDAFAPPSDEVAPDFEALAHQETTIVIMEQEALRESVELLLPERMVQGGSIFQRRELSVPLAPLLRTSTGARQAQTILELAERYGEPGPGNQRVAPPLSSAQLASLAGLDRERARQALALLERAGLIRRDRRALRILDLDGLRRFALG